MLDELQDVLAAARTIRDEARKTLDLGRDKGGIFYFYAQHVEDTLGKALDAYDAIK